MHNSQGHMDLYYNSYRIAGYLHGLQFYWISSIYHELVIFMDIYIVCDMAFNIISN